jgi:hypothetical protein
MSRTEVSSILVNFIVGKAQEFHARPWKSTKAANETAETAVQRWMDDARAEAGRLSGKTGDELEASFMAVWPGVRAEAIERVTTRHTIAEVSGDLRKFVEAVAREADRDSWFGRGDRVFVGIDPGAGSSSSVTVFRGDRLVFASPDCHNRPYGYPDRLRNR